MRAVTISIGKFHIVLAAGKVSDIKLKPANPNKATLKGFPGIPDGTEVNINETN